MIAALLLVLAQTATATPAPKLGGGFGQPKPTVTARARVVITDATLAPTGRGRGSFSIGNITGAPAVMMPAPDVADDAAKAQARMDAAARDGYWTAGNIRYNTHLLSGARGEWDAAEENCRRTPGCRPVMKPDGILPTGAEQRKKLGLTR
jgi:hypothetical protein